MSGRVLQLPDNLAAAILGAAARSYPSECCGLIEGVDSETGWRALAVHEAANVAEDPARRFLIDPEAQFKLLRGLRNSDRRIIGCFHSHPGGGPAPSATDLAAAGELDFLWLIAAGTPEMGFMLQAYVFSGESGFFPVELKQDITQAARRCAPGPSA